MKFKRRSGKWRAWQIKRGLHADQLYSARLTALYGAPEGCALTLEQIAALDWNIKVAGNVPPEWIRLAAAQWRRAVTAARP